MTGEKKDTDGWWNRNIMEGYRALATIFKNASCCAIGHGHVCLGSFIITIGWINSIDGLHI